MDLSSLENNCFSEDKNKKDSSCSKDCHDHENMDTSHENKNSHDSLHSDGCCKKKNTSNEEEREYFLRALAESENSRKRLEKQTEEKIKYALSQFATELLLVRDNMERALSSTSLCSGGDLIQSVQSLRQGIERVLQELDRIFTKFGILKVPALGQPLNPHYHQVMTVEDSDDENKDNLLSDDKGEFTVVNVLQEGYKLHDMLLRPALVGVRKLS